MTDFREGDIFAPTPPPHPWAAPKKPILNSVNLKGVFRTISNIYDEAFSQKYLTASSRCIFAEMLHHRYLMGFCIRLCGLVFFLYFSTFFVWMLEWTIWTFCCYSDSVQLLSSHDVIRNIIRYFPNHLLYIDPGNINFLYSYTVEM